jgi:chromosome segregation ATPase
MTPKDDLREQLANSRAAETKWQRECLDLVQKLDFELSRSDDLSANLEANQLKVKELERELADLRLLLHQSQSGMMY